MPPQSGEAAFVRADSETDDALLLWWAAPAMLMWRDASKGRPTAPVEGAVPGAVGRRVAMAERGEWDALLTEWLDANARALEEAAAALVGERD